VLRRFVASGGSGWSSLCACHLWVGFLTSCWPSGVLGGVWLERGENTIDPNQECPSQFTVYAKEGIVFVMIGIDPHKATHTAVAVDDDEHVIGEFTLEASNDQVERLCGHARDVPTLQRHVLLPSHAHSRQRRFPVHMDRCRYELATCVRRLHTRLTPQPDSAYPAGWPTGNAYVLRVQGRPRRMLRI
jgi:hypothetical protein